MSRWLSPNRTAALRPRSGALGARQTRKTHGRARQRSAAGPGLAVMGVLSMLAAGPARAEDSAAAIFRRFGLDGTWSADCSRPASADNPHVSWRLTQAGSVTHNVTFDGSTYGPAGEIYDASILNDGLIQFTLGGSGSISFIVTVEKSGEKMRTLRSVSTAGRVYYDEGMDLGSGKPSIFYERCGPAAPDS